MEGEDELRIGRLVNCSFKDWENSGPAEGTCTGYPFRIHDHELCNSICIMWQSKSAVKQGILSMSCLIMFGESLVNAEGRYT